VLHAVGRTACTMSQALEIDGGIVGQRVGLEVSPEVFDRIEFRGVGRQVLQMCRAGQDAFLDELALVGLEAIPDEHDGHAQLTLQVLEEVHRSLGIDVGVRAESKVQSDPVACRRDAQCGDGGDLLIVLAALPKYRGLSSHAPGAAHQGGHEHPGFVEENEGRSQARGVFFTRGQSCSIQALMRSSSRSSARRVGFWGEKPRPCRSRLTCAG
jgi:hypothetical protein